MDVIHVVGPFETELADTFMPLFAECDAKDNLKEPILIRMVSPGGSATVGLAMFDLVRAARHEVIIEAWGECSSIALVFLQAGDWRRVSRNCRSLVHNGSLDVSQGNVPGKNLDTMAKEIRTLDGIIHDIISKRSGRDANEVRKLCEDETTLDAVSMRSLGLADDIIDEDGAPKNVKGSFLSKLLATQKAKADEKPAKKGKKS